MRITCIGGGPAGLYFALLMKLQDARHEVTVIERNAPTDTFGWGVVFSDQTLARSGAPTQDRRPDPRRLQPLGRHRRPLPGPHAALHRPRLLRHRPHAPAQHPAGALRRARRRHPLFSRPTCPDDADVDADLIIACDGLNSRIRSKYAATYQPDIDCAAASSGWARRSCSTPSPSPFEKTEHGWFQAHAYRSTKPPRPSSSRRPTRCGSAAGLEPMTRRRASPSARSCSPST